MSGTLESTYHVSLSRMISLLSLALVVTAQFLKHRSQETATISIMVTLLIVGGLILWDQDRWKKAGFHGPFWFHMAALELGALSGWISSHVFQNSNWKWQALFLQSSQMLLFFVLLELATDKRVRRDSHYNLTCVSCISAHMLSSTQPLFELKSGFVDLFLITILGAALISGSIAAIQKDLDPIPLERRYVFTWVAASTAIILCWKFVVCR